MIQGASGAGVHEVVGLPRLARNVVRRPRLLDLLERRVPLSTVRGPAGSGKTVLVADWARTAGIWGIWVTIDASIATRATLWSTVAARLMDAGLVGSGAGPAPDPIEPGADLPAVLRHRLVGVDPVLILLDGLHAVQDREEVTQDVIRLLTTCPSMQIVAITRAMTPLESSLTAARMDCVVIGPQALRVTAPEAAQMVAAAGVTGTDPDALHRTSAGSPLVLRALALGAETPGPGIQNDAAVASAVAGGLLSDVSEQVRALLARLAIPEEFDFDLARGLSQPDSWSQTTLAACLRALEDQGLLVRSDPPFHARYRVHPVLRDTLLTEARAHLGTAWFPLHRLAARWCAERGMLAGAIAHAVTADDLSLVSEILIAHGMDRDAQNEVYPELAHLAPHAVAGHPVVAFSLAVGSYARRYKRSRTAQYFAEAVMAARVLGRRVCPAERAVLATIESVTLRFTGRPGQGVRAAKRALRLLGESSEALAPLRNQVGQLRLQNALTLAQAGLTPGARAALADNMADLDSMPMSVADSTRATKAVLHAFEGDMAAAAQAFVAGDHRSTAGASAAVGCGAAHHLHGAIAALEEFDLTRARQHTERAVEYADAIEFRAYFAIVETVADLFAGQRSRGWRRLEGYTTHEGGRRTSMSDQRVLAPARALLYLADGHAGQAEQALAPVATDNLTALVVRALAAHLTGDHARVMNLAARLQLAGAPPRLAVLADLLTAASSLRTGDREVASVALERMAAVLVNFPLRSHLALIPRRDLLALAAFAEGRGLDLPARMLDATGVPDVLPARASSVALTDRERVVLRALTESSSSARIAQQLLVSPNTVKSQLRSLYRKLGVTGRHEALTAAYARGLLEPAEHADEPELEAEDEADRVEYAGG